MKITLVSIRRGNRTISVFIPLPYVNEKAVLSADDFRIMSMAVGAQRGDTITVG